MCVQQIFFLYMYMKIFKTLLYLKRLSWSCFILYGSIHFYSTFNIYIWYVQKILKIRIYNCSIFYFLKSLKYVQKVIVVFIISLELPPFSKYIVSLHIAYIYIYTLIHYVSSPIDRSHWYIVYYQTVQFFALNTWTNERIVIKLKEIRRFVVLVFFSLYAVLPTHYIVKEKEKITRKKRWIIGILSVMQLYELVHKILKVSLQTLM